MAIQHVQRQLSPPCNLTYWWQLPPAGIPLPTLFQQSLSHSSESGWKLLSPSLQFVVYPGLISTLTGVPIPCRTLCPPAPLGMARHAARGDGGSLPHPSPAAAPSCSCLEQLISTGWNLSRGCCGWRKHGWAETGLDVVREIPATPWFARGCSGSGKPKGAMHAGSPQLLPPEYPFLVAAGPGLPRRGGQGGGTWGTPGLGGGDQGHPCAPLWAGRGRGGVWGVDRMGFFPDSQTPLGAGLHHPHVRAAEDEEQCTGCTAAPGRWQRVLLWGCEADCNWH